MNESLLGVAHELEERDRRLAAEIDAIASLQHRTHAVGRAACRLGRFLEALPAERAGLERQIAHEEAALAERERALERAREELEGADEEDRAAARRALVRTQDALSVTRRELEHAQEELHRLEAEAKAAAEELALLRAEAEALTSAIHDAPAISRGTVPLPGAAPQELSEWSSRARAALLLARSGLDSQRERVVREANELAAAALGEPGAVSVAGVVERLERAFG